MASILKTYNTALNDIDILVQYRTDSLSLAPKYQYLVSEVIMLRLFSILEATFGEVAWKLACNARYRNGNLPIILHRCSSIDNANLEMLNRGRGRNVLRYTRWTTANYIQNSIRFVLDVTDAYNRNIQIHGPLINEMRIVRNHIAHKDKSTTMDYKLLIRRMIGANAKIKVGGFLTSTSTAPTPRIDGYLLASKVILNDITSG